MLKLAGRRPGGTAERTFADIKGNMKSVDVREAAKI